MSGIVLALCLGGDIKTMAQDITKLPFPAQAVQGKLFGVPFKPTGVKFKRIGDQVVRGTQSDRSTQWAITFRTGKDFFADQEISVWVSIDPTDKLDGLKLIEKPHRFFEDSSSDFTWKGRKRSVGMGLTSVFVNAKIPKSRDEIASDGFSAKLALGKVVNGKLPGKIIVVLPDNMGYLAGSFNASKG